jgi:uncharacterized protein involved in exopolysaccharide biosynthesis
LGRTYLETFLRHKLILILPVLVCLVVGTALAFRAPREYVAGASLWADTRVPEISTVGTTGGQSPPSAGQATLLMQLLGTRTFTEAVAQVSPLADDYNRADPISAASILAGIRGSATVLTPGPQLMTLSVMSHDPDEAIGIARAIVEQYNLALVDQATTRAEAQVDYNRTQLEVAQNALEESDTESTQAAYAEAAAALNASTADLSIAASTGLRVVDEPDIAFPQARKKGIIFGAAGGFMAGAALALVALVFLMARDRSLRGEDDVAAAGLDIGGSIPAFGRRERHSVGV